MSRRIRALTTGSAAVRMPLAPPVSAGCGSAGSSPNWIGRGWVDRWWCQVLGAGVVAQVVVAVRASPQLRARLEHRVGPTPVGLQAVMPAAQSRQVVGCGWATVGIRDHV